MSGTNSREIQLPAFESYQKAATAIAQHWPGWPVEAPEGLLMSIQGLGDPEVYKQAIRFAIDATTEDGAARSIVEAADLFLWTGYEAGSGVVKLIATVEPAG